MDGHRAAGRGTTHSLSPPDAPVIARKLGHTLLVVLGVVTLVFGALRLSGDPAATMIPGGASVEYLFWDMAWRLETWPV